AISLVSSLRFAVAPRPGGARLLGASALAMAIGGMIGLVFGLEHCLRHLPEVEQPRQFIIFALGLGEAMLSLGLALAVGFADAVLYTVGVWRSTPRAAGGSAAMPAALP